MLVSLDDVGIGPALSVVDRRGDQARPGVICLEFGRQHCMDRARWWFFSDQGAGCDWQSQAGNTALEEATEATGVTLRRCAQKYRQSTQLSPSSGRPLARAAQPGIQTLP